MNNHTTINQPSTPEQQVSISVVNTQPTTHNQLQPTVSDVQPLTQLYNVLLVSYTTALVVQVLTFIPLTLPALAQLPKVAAVIIIGVGAWLAALTKNHNRYNAYKPALLTLAVAIGILIGL